MTTAQARRSNISKIETEMLDRIEQDLASAQSEGRVEDVLFHFEELAAVHMHTENGVIKKRCAKLICQDQRKAA